MSNMLKRKKECAFPKGERSLAHNSEWSQENTNPKKGDEGDMCSDSMYPGNTCALITHS